MSARRPRPVLFALLLATASLTFAVPVQAASCNGGSHLVTLTGGTVTPATGTATTMFTFSVVYTSNAGCAPTSMQVTVTGVGTFPMTGTGTNYAAGVTYRRSMTIPVGSRPYSFRTVSGSGLGSQTVTLTAVSPTRVNVVGPTPAPTPVPPPPTPVPPPPTPAPTVTASPAATPSGEPSASGGIGSSGPSAGASAGANEALGPPYSPPRPQGPGMPTSGDAADSNPHMTVWLIATIGGLGLLLFLNRPAPRLAGGTVPARQAAPMAAEVATMRQATPRGRRAPAGEEGMARWLRPSVQAARYAEPARHPRRGDDEPDEG